MTLPETENCPAPALLEVCDLEVSFDSAAGSTRVLKKISFEVGLGEIVGIVGESGSGKSVSCRAIMGLLPDNASVSGSIMLGGKELLGLDEKTLRPLRGNEMSMIFQNPSSHLDPLMKIGQQISEPLTQLKGMASGPARAAAIERLREVQLDHAEQRTDNYPHQLSGGMKQRALIAAAMACEPRLLLADEPTTALDVTVQARILDLLLALNRSHSLSIVLVSHDLAVVAQICHRVVVMRHGEIVEWGNTREVIHEPQHAYTRKLIESQPGRLAVVKPAVERAEIGAGAAQAPPLLEIDRLCVEFVLPGAGLPWPFGKRSKNVLRAVLDVSLALERGESLGIVGESGSGKSTIARVIMGLVSPVSGDVRLRGKTLLGTRGNGATDFRRTVQMAFQNPFDSLNPRFSVRRTIAEPLLKHRLVPSDQAAVRVDELMRLVELDPSLVDRKPHQLSGGQCQRVGIARALAMNPEILIADEITSALDVTIQAQVIELLNRLRREMGLTVIFISHDLALVESFCDRVAVFQSGRLLESGPVEEVLNRPREAYTRNLIASAPKL
jgi:peptide/nickel transport system ATP-binding protein